MNKALAVVKYLAIAAFVVTLFTTYYLRSEVLKLSTIRFSAEHLKAEEGLAREKNRIPSERMPISRS